MIIFDIDTLADCEHRRHLVDRSKNENYVEGWTSKESDLHWYDKNTLEKWKPDWKSFYEACGDDKPIQPVIDIWNQQISLGSMGDHEIWSGRCESVRDKTLEWLDKHLLCFESHQLKMRPSNPKVKGCSIAYLKSIWLEEILLQGINIEFVFDCDPDSIRMFRSRGIFVFNCNQSDGEF